MKHPPRDVLDIDMCDLELERRSFLVTLTSLTLEAARPRLQYPSIRCVCLLLCEAPPTWIFPGSDRRLSLHHIMVTRF